MGRHALEVAFLVAAPMLLTALTIGLIVGIFQAATQINDSSLSFIPKLIGVFLVLVLAGPWLLSIMSDYLRSVLSSIPDIIGQ
jgi:flagellar biosynthetic protein FliQ